MIEYSFFEVIVAGDNPEELLAPYDSKLKVDKYIVYKFSDAHKLKEETLKYFKNIIEKESDKNNKISTGVKEYYTDEYNELKEMSDEDAFYSLTYEYDYDEENNAVTDRNPKGRYSFYQKGKLFSVPFITKDGRETFQARKGEVDWEKMHLSGGEIYEIAWEMVMEGRKPTTEYEKNIYENMKERTAYFQSFGNKETYVLHSTAFWAYAFVDSNNWYELEENVNQFDWVKNFYERFIKPLDDNVLLTIYECKK